MTGSAYRNGKRADPNGKRAEALAIGAKTFSTGLPCKNGHESLRYTATMICVACKQETFKKVYAKDKNRWLGYANKWREQNREHMREYAERYREQYPEQTKQASKAYRQTHEYKHVAHERITFAKRQNRLPPWITKQHLRQMEEVYKQAEALQKKSGIRMAVDHIVPFKGKTVCGLHVPWNLQVIGFSDNCSKHAKLTDAVYRPVSPGIMMSGKALPWNWSSK